MVTEKFAQLGDHRLRFLCIATINTMAGMEQLEIHSKVRTVRQRDMESY